MWGIGGATSYLVRGFELLVLYIVGILLHAEIEQGYYAFYVYICGLISLETRSDTLTEQGLDLKFSQNHLSPLD